MDILHGTRTDCFPLSAVESPTQSQHSRLQQRGGFTAGAGVSLGPTVVSLCWQANTHTYPSLSRHSLWGCDIQCNSLCGLSEAWFYIYLPSPAALSLTGSYNTYTHTEKCSRNLLLLQCFVICTPTQGLYLVWSVIFGYGMFLLNHLNV